MARTLTVQNNGTGGEFAPITQERADLVQYNNGFSVLSNFIIHPQGGVSKRPGTRFVAAAKDSTIRLIPFVFSETDAAVLEFGPNYIRVYANNIQVMSGGSPVEIVTPYTAVDLVDLRYTQEADTLFLFHPNHAPRKLVRLSATSWQLRDFPLEPPPSREEGFIPSAILTLAALTGNDITFTASSGVFLETDVDRVLIEDPTLGTGAAIITSVTSSTVVVVDIISDFTGPSPIASGLWRLLGTPVAQLSPDKSNPIGAAITLTLQRIQADATELTVNGDFAAGNTGWTDKSGPIISTGTADGGAPTDTKLTDAAATFQTDGVQVNYRAIEDVTGNEDSVVSIDSETILTTSTGGADWTTGIAYTIRQTGTFNTTGGKAELNGGANGVAWIQQAITTVSGVTYRILFDVFDQPLSAQVGSTDGSSDLFAEASFDIGNMHEIFITATSTTIYLQFRNNQNITARLDNVTVKKFDIDGWRTADVGKFVRINSGICKITQFLSARQVKATIQRSLSNSSAASSGTWTLEEAEWDSIKGWPRTGTIFASRLVLGGTKTFPNRVWASRTKIFNDFGIGVANDDAIELQLAANEVNLIQWIVGEKMIAVGTRGEEFTISSATGQSLTPTNFSVESPTSIGSAAIGALRVQRAVLYIQAGAIRLREFIFDSNTGERLSIDLTRLAPHISGNGFVSMAYQSLPDPTVWLVTTDNNLVSLAYLRDEQIVGWTSHNLGDMVKDVTTIPHNGRSQVWVAVDRGMGTPFIEFMDDTGDGHYSTLQVDSGINVTGPTSIIPGLNHLEGRSVIPIGDGLPQPAKIVSGGQITLDTPATVIEVGLPFTPTFTLMRPTVRDQNIMGLRGAVASTFVSFLDTADATVNGHTVSFLKGDSLTDTAIPLNTEVIETSGGGYDQDMAVTISQIQPLPITVRAVTRRLILEDI